MIWVFEAIATLPGPQFLLLYVCISAATVVICHQLTRRLDTTGALPSPALPSEPDPYEIAYLRGGANELTRLMVFELIERGYLQVSGEKREQRIAHSPNHSEPAALSTAERLVFNWFAAPQSVEAVFNPSGPVSAIDQILPYQQRFEDEQLITGPEVRAAAWKTGLLGAALLAAVGGYKLLAALTTGHHNVGFLLLLGLGSLVALFLASRPPRLNARGRVYLERLRAAFGTNRRADLERGAGQVSPAMLLLFALYGVAALAGTPYAYATELFHQSASGSSSSTSGDGCGSCGGGDGGCDGCGGCGD